MIKTTSFLIFAFLLLAGFKPPVNNDDWSVRILYKCTFDFSRLEFSFAGDKMSYTTRTRTGSGPARKVTAESREFDLKQSESIRNYVLSTDWNSVSTEVPGITGEEDRYQIIIQRDREQFVFNIMNGSVPAVNNLLRQCYLTLPNEEAREKFPFGH